MPAPQPPRRGMLPSVLDRLLDPESAGTAVMTGYTVEKMANAVWRDLDELLNTVNPHHRFPDDFPETRDSIVPYGLFDLRVNGDIQEAETGKRKRGHSVRGNGVILECLWPQTLQDDPIPPYGCTGLTGSAGRALAQASSLSQ